MDEWHYIRHASFYCILVWCELFQTCNVFQQLELLWLIHSWRFPQSGNNRSHFLQQQFSSPVDSRAVNRGFSGVPFFRTVLFSNYLPDNDPWGNQPLHLAEETSENQIYACKQNGFYRQHISVLLLVKKKTFLETFIMPTVSVNCSCHSEQVLCEILFTNMKKTKNQAIQILITFNLVSLLLFVYFMIATQDRRFCTHKASCPTWYKATSAQQLKLS